MVKSVNGAPSVSVYYFRCSYTMDHESKFSFSRGNTQQVVLIIPAPVTAISQPIKLNDGAEAGWIMHNRYLLGCVCMQMRVRERASCIMPTPHLCYSRAACDRVKENPPEQNICQLGYVALCIAHTAAYSHCTPLEISALLSISL